MDCRVQCQEPLSSHQGVVVVEEEASSPHDNDDGESVVVAVPTFTFRKPSTCHEFGGDDDDELDRVSVDKDGALADPSGDINDYYRQNRDAPPSNNMSIPPDEPANNKNSFLLIQSIDVCRICQCGPNTLATPTPLLLTPVTSPKKRFPHENETREAVPTSSSLSNATGVELKRSPSSLMRTQQESLQSPEKQQQTQYLLSPDYNLISPCVCSGSLKYVHQCCLQNWIRASNNTNCELCKHPFELRSKFKPLWKWEALPMVPGEKKRIVCSALFHTVALACVVWSLYVLIDRTVEELSQSDLEWQFWTKIIVEAIGCLGAGILTYVWGKSYVVLLIRWITFNRSFVIIPREEENSKNDAHTTIRDTGGGTVTTHNQQQSAAAVEQELINLIN